MKENLKTYQLYYLHENQIFFSAKYQCTGIENLKEFIKETLSEKNMYPACFADEIKFTEV
jgi:hypothetical protein